MRLSDAAHELKDVEHFLNAVCPIVVDVASPENGRGALTFADDLKKKVESGHHLD